MLFPDYVSEKIDDEGKANYGRDSNPCGEGEKYSGALK